MSATAEHLLTLQEDNLPPGWTLATIEGLVGKGGVFIDGDWVESKDQDPEGDVRLIQLADVGDGEYRNKSARFLTYERAIQLGCTFLQKGDVLIARMPDPLGRACIFPGDTKPAVTVVDVAVVRSAAGEFNHRWLMYFVNAPAFRAVVASMQSGSTRKRISRGNLAKIALPVPPLDQQKHIVAEIEKQFSRLDEAVANLKRVKANLKRYKAAVLKAAVEGRLVETEAEIARREGRDYETGAQLLQRIIETRRSQWLVPGRGKRKGNYKEPAAPDTADLPESPEGWVWARLDAIAALKGGITVDSKRKDSTARLVPYLRVANVQRGYIDLTEVKFIVAPESDIKELRLQRDDILFNEGGDRDKLGRGWIWEGQLADCIHQNHVFRARLFLSEVCSKLVSWWGNSFGKDYFLRKGKQTTNLASINLTKLSAFPVPLAPAAEQIRLVSEVDRRLSLVTEVEAQVDANYKRAERLRQSILSNAFSGQLLGVEHPVASAGSKLASRSV
ncbi:MAG: restriction endonuclease subunit S [Porticoccaceae bacterium]